jgi:hypothetical protein
MKFYFLIAALTIFTNSLQKDQFKTFALQDDLKKTEIVNLSGLAADVRFIKLEYNPDCILSYIKDVIIFSEFVLVCDVKNNLYLFTQDGKFLRRIGKIGRGPGEYTNILGVDVDTKAKLIYVLNNTSQKLIAYDYQGNFFPSSISCTDKISFCIYDEKFYLHTPSNIMLLRDNPDEKIKNQLTELTSKGELLNTYHSIDKNLTQNKSIETASFTKGKSNLFYHVNGENKVYSINKNGIKTEFCFELGNNSTKSTQNELQNSSGSSEGVNINDIRIADKYIFLNFRNSNKPGLLFYDGKSFHNVNSDNGGTFKDDIDGTGKVFYQLFIRENTIIEPIEARKILKYDSNSVSLRINQIKEATNEIDNPVLRIISLK